MAGPLWLFSIVALFVGCLQRTESTLACLGDMFGSIGDPPGISNHNFSNALEVRVSLTLCRRCDKPFIYF
jgi:hypothetical protein